MPSTATTTTHTPGFRVTSTTIPRNWTTTLPVLPLPPLRRQLEKEEVEAYLKTMQMPESLRKELMESLSCPIKLNIMTDPVVMADGYTYERSSIVQWMQTRATSPLTNQPLLNNNMARNWAIWKLLEQIERLTATTENNIPIV